MLLALLFGCAPANPVASVPQVIDGVIDLRDRDFASAGPVELNGAWEFYWARFVAPADFRPTASGTRQLATEDARPDLVMVPGKWNQQDISGQRFSADGFATYRLRILLDEPGDPIPVFAFRLRRIYTAYRLYVNGAQIAAVGQVGESAATTVPDYRILLRPIALTEPVLDVVLHIANYDHLNAGLPAAILFGTEANIRQERESRLAFDLFLIGGLLILGIYQLGLYLLSKVDRSPILLGIFCLIIALRHFVDDERYVDDLFPDLPWHILHRIAYGTFALAVIVMVEHIHRFFRAEAIVAISRTLQGLAFAFLCLVSVAPPKVYSSGSVLFVLTAVLAAIYLIGVVVRAAIRRRDAAWMSVLSLLCLIPGVLDKILLDRGYWSGFEILPLCMFGFLLIQTLAVSKRFSRSFISIERSSRELEQRVADRTRELNDSTEQLAEARDRAEDSNRAKSEFLATMSHEIRTPLNAILGTSQLLREEGVSTEERNTYVRLLNRAGQNLLRLINQVLDFSRLEVDQLQLTRVAFSPAELVAEISDIMTVPATKRQLRIEREIEITGAALYYGDPDRINQVLTNLLGNAIKFTDGERVCLRLSLTEVAAQKQLRFEVEDDGPGIPADRVDQIFERFTQLDSSDARRHEGAGLGLAITKKLVDLMGGTIQHEVPAGGSGSRFVVTIPAEPAGARTADHGEARSGSNAAPAQATQADVPFPERQRVLLAEDNADNRLLVKAFLKSSGLRLVFAENGREAVERFAAVADAPGDLPAANTAGFEQAFDLILMDIQMPELDGYAATRAIRALEAERGLTPIPILALTANATAEDVRRSADAGCSAHLSKPILKRVLLDALREYL